ncbi:tyrosine--tRNA ligase [Fibrobacter intestinalis]|uniref:Tyrosine--tRNA ligase n=1 Tax=Fibrobacter intestinalis TaxID=28122 RepID=A0A1T4LM25_9BACT|nr:MULTISPECIES: tyrosine--tRNA ligase [Fibrobacter]PBC73921.1 tyrosyl-tRNA synthetase [Fibrobacter sp. NR9]SJZ55494.1 tyrosyl-tRNA synthetase [Fibrobacter intestinalis]
MQFRPVKEQLDILLRGVAEIIPADELEQKLQKSYDTGIPLRVKLGVDPTAPDVHLGHTVVMRKLRQFQDLGHTVVLIVGDYTAQIGDPSGRNKARPRLSHEQVLENAKEYQQQFFRVVREDRVEIRYNGEWFSKLPFSKVTELMGQFTVAQMLEREDFHNRYVSNSPISLHEFMYPMMQGYDSVAIQSDIELGGTDQKFNVCRGRDLQMFEKMPLQIGMFMPILLGTDGKAKMSKSLGNYVGVNEPADVMYHKIYNLADSIVENWFELLTDVPLAEIKQMMTDVASGKLNPNVAKDRLAKNIVAQYYGAEAAEAAAVKEKEIHSGNAIPSDAKECRLDAGEYKILDLLVQVKAFSSKGEARRMVQNGGVKLAGEKVSDPMMEVKVSGSDQLLIQIGKRNFFKVNF